MHNWFDKGHQRPINRDEPRNIGRENLFAPRIIRFGPRDRLKDPEANETSWPEVPNGCHVGGKFVLTFQISEVGNKLGPFACDFDKKGAKFEAFFQGLKDGSNFPLEKSLNGQVILMRADGQDV